MDHLPDDILIIIFKFLNEEDQFSVAWASRRFHVALFYIWQKKYKSLHLKYSKKLKQKNIRLLLESIKDTVETMELAEVTFEGLNVIRQHSYPKVKTLSINWCRYRDENVLEITKSCPNIRSLTLKDRNISGRHIKNLKFLKNLNLLECPDIQFIYIQEIFKELRLKSIKLEAFKWQDWTSDKAFTNFRALEHICSVNCEPLLLSNVSLLSNLKVLGIAHYKPYFIDKMFKDVAIHKHNDLIELRVGAWGPEPSILLNGILNTTFQNLKKVYIRCCNISGFGNILPYLPNLREISFGYCKGLEEELILVLLYSTQMELINIISCFCRFKDLDLNVKNIVKSRTKLLHFNFYKNLYRDTSHEYIVYENIFQEDIFNVHIIPEDSLNENNVKLNVSGSSSMLKITREDLTCEEKNDFFPLSKFGTHVFCLFVES